RHEVDRVRRGHLRRDDQVAFIFPAFVVDENEHAAVARFVDDRFGPDQHFRGAALDQLFEAAERVGGRVPVRGTKLSQAVGMEAGGSGETGSADLAGGDDRLEPFDEGRAHRRSISHYDVMISGNISVPIVNERPASGRYSEL